MSNDFNVSKDILLNYLIKHIDLEYLKIQKNILPNNNCEILGVRMPIIHKLAFEISNNIDIFLPYVPCYHEEKVVVLLSIIYSKKNFDNKINLIIKKIKLIDSWSICDTICSAFKDFKNNLEDGWRYIEKALNFDYSYANRFAVVIMLFYYINDEYIDRVLTNVLKTKNNDYYVKMALAWLLSMSYFKYKNKTIDIIKKLKDTFVKQKTISKIKESRKFDKKTDCYLLDLKHC